MPVLDLGKRTIGYSVVRGNSRRYTYFRFKPDMTLEVVLPRGRSVDVDRLLQSRLSWVRSEFDKISSSRSVLTPGSLMFGGVTHGITFSFGFPDTLHVDQTKGVATIVASDRRAVTELVRRFFLKESSAYVVRRVAELAPKMGVRPSRVDVREIGKWGYCTRSGRISFSWQLAALPDDLRDYVILHELTHLVHFDHSRGFKKTLLSVCPDYRIRERELNNIVPYDRLRPPS